MGNLENIVLILVVINMVDLTYDIQYKYDKYFADFYLPHVNLLFELDGKTFHGSIINRKKDSLKCKVANTLGYNMIRVWCSRANDVSKLEIAVNKLSGDDLAEFISAIPKRMINSVNLIKGCDINNIANGENQTTGNAVPSLGRNSFEGVETRSEPNDNFMVINSSNSAGHC